MRALIVAIVCVASVAAAEPRSLAIDVDAKDASSSKLADALAAALRQVTAKHADLRNKVAAKQVTSAVIAAGCTASQPACAASIGDKLAVDVMLVGELETRGTHRVLVLSLVDVKNKRRVRSLREVAAASVDARKWARTLIARIADDATGDLVLSANAQRGQVLLDGQPVTELFEGRATLLGIAAGTHQVQIRAPGYKPLEIDVTVDGRTQQAVLLDAVAP